MLVNPTLRHKPAPSDSKENGMITFGEGISRPSPFPAREQQGKIPTAVLKIPNGLHVDLWIKQ